MCKIRHCASTALAIAEPQALKSRRTDKVGIVISVQFGWAEVLRSLRNFMLYRKFISWNLPNASLPGEQERNDDR